MLEFKAVAGDGPADKTYEITSGPHTGARVRVGFTRRQEKDDTGALAFVALKITAALVDAAGKDVISGAGVPVRVPARVISTPVAAIKDPVVETSLTMADATREAIVSVLQQKVVLDAIAIIPEEPSQPENHEEEEGADVAS